MRLVDPLSDDPELSSLVRLRSQEVMSDQSGEFTIFSFFQDYALVSTLQVNPWSSAVFSSNLVFTGRLCYLITADNTGLIVSRYSSTLT